MNGNRHMALRCTELRRRSSRRSSKGRLPPYRIAYLSSEGDLASEGSIIGGRRSCLSWAPARLGRAATAGGRLAPRHHLPVR